MKNDTEIKLLSLEDQQKLVQDMAAVPQDSKLYARAQQIIALIKDQKGYKDPKPVEVKNIAGHDISVNGRSVPKDGVAKVFPWELAALARFLEPVTKAAALIVFAFLLLFTSSSQAQQQQTAIGGAGSFWVQNVAGLNGGTNSWQGTNLFNASIISTNYTTNLVVTTTNSVQYFVPNTVTNYSTNVPGVVNVNNYDLFDFDWGFNVTNGITTVVTATATFSYSPDNVNWRSNALQSTLLGVSNQFAMTNVTFSLFGPGWWRLDGISIPTITTNQITNVVARIVKKANRSGP
jgi:hypothetical protein